MERDINLYDRVTSVLAPFSGIDKVPKDILDAACARGTSVHALAQGCLEGIEVDVPEQYKGYMDSFRQWADGKKFLPNPGRLYDDQLMFTGEMDGLYYKDDVQCIFDLKTSQKEGVCWRYQSAAYSYLYAPLIDNLHLDSTFIILDKHGGEPKEFLYKFTDSISMFMRCLVVYKKFFKTKNNTNGSYEYL